MGGPSGVPGREVIVCKLISWREEWRTQRLELAEEFRAQRAEVLAQTTALANAITAARS